MDQPDKDVTTQQASQEQESKPAKKTYSSIGKAMKEGDFAAALEDLQNRQQSGEIKELLRVTPEQQICELDRILFQLPMYCMKRQANENKEMVMTAEMHEGAMEFLEFLMKNGANPNSYMKVQGNSHPNFFINNGANAFLMACSIPTTQVVKYMLENDYIPENYSEDLKHTYKTNADHRDGMGNNALHYAVMHEAVEVIDYLVKELNFDVNRKNFLNKDSTVLHHACGYSREKSIDKLLELGANPLLKNSHEYRPMDMIAGGYDESIQQDYADEPETVQKWIDLYEKMKTVTEQYQVTQSQKPVKRKYRTVF